MTSSRYLERCSNESKEIGKKSAQWVVNFNNGNVNNNHRNNNACVRAVRSGEYQSEAEVTLKEIYDAWRVTRKGKKPSHNQLSFDARWADRLLDLQSKINAGTWEPSPSSCFIAKLPKAREIHAPDFSDRVVHHWLIPKLEAIWEPGFIFDSYANRKEKGSHKAVERLKSFVRQVYSGQGGGWYLQLDIHNFFNSIHRPTLWKIIKKKLDKVNASELIKRTTHALLKRSPLHAGVVNHYTPEEAALVPPHKRLENAKPGCGLPIGNLSSQFFSNVYMDKLDQFVKHTLKAKRYIRYVDDFVLVHHDRQQLEKWQVDIENFIAVELKLKLKPDIKLRPLSDGVDFLGYIVRPTHTLVRRRVVSHARAAFSEWESMHIKDGCITATPADIRLLQSKYASYYGHMKHANSTKLYRTIIRRFNWLPTAITPRKFHYMDEGKKVKLKVLPVLF